MIRVMVKDIFPKPLYSTIVACVSARDGLREGVENR